MEDEFDILAAKALAGEATREEQSRLDSLLEDSPERRAEFDSLRATWASLETAGPAAFVSDSVPATIPEARLRQLQQVVRDSRSESSDSASTATAARSTPTPPQTPWQTFRRWLQLRRGLALGAACAALVLGAIGLGVWMRPASQRVAPSNADAGRPAGHLIVLQGESQIRRGEHHFAASTVATLHHADEVTLTPSSIASVITPKGEFTLHGPVRTNVNQLVADSQFPTNQPTNSVTPLADKTSLAMLFDPVDELTKSTWVATTRSAQAIPIYSPAGATASLTPVILWKAEAGKTYEVTIRDEFDSATPAWRLTNATPPVDFASIEGWRNRPLADRGLYRLRVRETGQPLSVSEITFRTYAEESRETSNTPTGALQEAYRILSGKSALTGDALALLLTLPPDLARSELALRLKLIAFSQLGLEADWENAAAALRRTQ